MATYPINKLLANNDRTIRRSQLYDGNTKKCIGIGIDQTKHREKSDT